MRPLPLIALLLIAPVVAQEADPPVPRPRPDAAATPDVPDAREEQRQGGPEAPEAPGPAAPLPRPRPAPEPPPAGTPDAAAAESHPPAGARIYQTACPAVLAGQVEAEVVPPIAEGQCGIRSPLAVTALLVNGRMVPLSSSATLSCGMATALPQWMSAVDAYVQAHEETEIAQIIAGTSYMCRNVNGATAGTLSDHAFADALDVVGFVLADGRRVTVEAGWNGGAAAGQSLVRYAHDAACSQFMTVLGPEANALHRDHLHLDLLCHGRSCTARLCQ